MMRNLMRVLLPTAMAIGLVACGDNTATTDMPAASPDLTFVALPDMVIVAMPDMVPPGPPPAPTLGAQIDRMGRGAINVAATNPFDLDESKLGSAKASRDATRDAYNQDADPTKWVADWTPALEFNLAIYDGADGTCGNQLAADMTKKDATRYQTLAGVLADDKIYLDTSQKTCGFYLAVEAGVLGVTLADCGGRTPNEPVVNETYTFLTAGLAGMTAPGTFAVTDGLGQTNPKAASVSATFPFLGAPN